MIKGKTSDDQKYVKGYATGDLGLSFGTLSALCGNVLGDPYYCRFDSPDKSINGIETHDNATAWDKMHACCSNEDKDTRQKRHKMMLACTMVAQGVPFIHAGFEFAGTKGDNSNSYNAGDSINQMDWRRAVYNQHLIEYTKKAIALRKKYRGFRLHFTRQIEKYVRLSVAEGGGIFYEITCSDPVNSTQVIRVIINPTFDDRWYNFEPEWRVVFDENGNEQTDTVSEVRVPALSVIVCVR
jgi:pullulanase